MESQQGGELFKLLDTNRAYLRRWHPWVDVMRSEAEVQKAIAFWRELRANRRGDFFGIWFDGRLCGMIEHQTVDWANRWAGLSYWLDEAHQGKGIMTACCRVLIAEGFEQWKLNRITIECATRNTRSRAIAERLGFKLEGIIRQIEWLHDGFVDHALYGLLRCDLAVLNSRPGPSVLEHGFEA